MDIGQLLKDSKGVRIDKYLPGDSIFVIGERLLHYYYISEGTVELKSFAGKTKKSVNSIKHSGEGLGDFIMFTGERSFFSAVALSNCKILKMSKTDFLVLLERHPELSLRLLYDMSNGLYYKSLMSEIYLKDSTSEKVITILDYLKRNETDQNPYSFQIPLTRREIGNLIGMRVETVIRTIKRLEKQNVLKIIDQKIFY